VGGRLIIDPKAQDLYFLTSKSSKNSNCIMNATALHTFHIPVMGLAYTIDSPIKVARYGIDSVISIIEDKLIELMRQHYYNELKLPYKPITQKDEDYRAKLIT
jgi:hypothetical protein